MPSSNTVDRSSVASMAQSQASLHADRYMSLVGAGFDRRAIPPPSTTPTSAPYDPQNLIDRHLAAAAAARGYVHHSTPPVSGSTGIQGSSPGLVNAADGSFDRRGAANPGGAFDHPHHHHQLPAMAHQPPQQVPYSNLFAVDPLLHAQLRAANMMYRMDY